MALFKCQGEAFTIGTIINQDHNTFNNAPVNPSTTQEIIDNFNLTKMAKLLKLSASGVIGSTGYSNIDYLQVKLLLLNNGNETLLASSSKFNHAQYGYGRDGINLNGTLYNVPKGTYAVIVRYSNNDYPNANTLGIFENTAGGTNWNGTATNVKVVASK